MTEIHIAVVGVGPRGLTVLERMVEYADLIPSDIEMIVDIFDENECGEGVHRSCQPDHLLINTLASQVSIFEHGSKMHASTGASLTEWARSSGFRLVDDRFVVADEGVQVEDIHHLPRSLLGGYLRWYYGALLERLPRKIRVIHRRTRVDDLEVKTDRIRLVLSDGSSVFTDYVFLTTGHSFRRPTPEDSERMAFVTRSADRNAAVQYMASPYPVEKLDRIRPGSVVAVQGFGLTAHDVISSLTIGRGGRYHADGDRLVYGPSGREPRIRLFSRSCLPFAARGINQKGLTGRHMCRFFTPQAVETIRAARRTVSGRGQLDFKKDLLPLLMKEMSYAWRMAFEQVDIDPATFEPTATEIETISTLLWPLKRRSFSSLDETRAFFDGLVREDLAEALRGNLTSPVKAATDVMRDAREAFRTAVEYGGLTPESHRFFLEEFNPIINRVSFGPPLRRNLEFLALREAGVVDIAGGVGAKAVFSEDSSSFVVRTPFGEKVEETSADALIVARLDAFSPVEDSSELWINLLRRGIVRPYMNGTYHPGGLDIDRRLHPISSEGSVQERIWALGYVVEGAHYYTHNLPRPNMPSRHARDAGSCVVDLMRCLAFASETAPMDRGNSSGIAAEAKMIDVREVVSS